MKKFIISILIALFACAGAFAYQYELENDGDSLFQIGASDETDLGDIVFMIEDVGEWYSMFIFIVEDESEAIETLTSLAEMEDEEIYQLISYIGENWNITEDEDGNSFYVYDTTVEQ